MERVPNRFGNQRTGRADNAVHRAPDVRHATDRFFLESTRIPAYGYGCECPRLRRLTKRTFQRPVLGLLVRQIVAEAVDQSGVEAIEGEAVSQFSRLP